MTNRPAATRRVRVVTDSTADLPHEVAHALGISVVPLNVIFGDQQFADGVDLTGPEFYVRLSHMKNLPTTAQPAPGLFSNLYQLLTSDGSDVISLHISGELSGVVGSAHLAAADLGLINPADGPRVCVIDTRSMSMCIGWMAIFAARAARAGKSLAEIEALVRSMIPRVRIMGAFDTLEMLQRGGRIGMAQAFLGTMLAIKPIIQLKDGQVEPMERVRTKNRALQRIAEMVASFGPLDALSVVHGYDDEDAAKLVKMLAPIYPRDQIMIGHIGAVLGTHIGPRAVGVCCVIADKEGRRNAD